ncbi:MAG: hypothetical protein DCF22_21900 [Leptolyngbya sp.]|nr:MAG: hypothetical protein DCF22_21900 [Leptolyngbya sp.]
MPKEDFPDIKDWNELRQILCDIPSIQNSQDRRGFLRTFEVADRYINNLQLDKAVIPFVNDLTSDLQRKYENNSNPPTWGFINKKPVLAKFLENLISSNSYVYSDANRAFITNFVERWRLRFEAKLVSYRKTYRQQLREKSQSEKDRLSEKLTEIEQEANLEQICREIRSKVEEDERKRNCTIAIALVIVLGIIGLSISFFPKQTLEDSKKPEKEVEKNFEKPSDKPPPIDSKDSTEQITTGFSIPVMRKEPPPPPPRVNSRWW